MEFDCRWRHADARQARRTCWTDIAPTTRSGRWQPGASRPIGARIW